MHIIMIPLSIIGQPITVYISSRRLRNRQQIYVPPHHQQLRQNVQRQLQVYVLRLLQPQDLAYHDQHHRYVPRYAHELVRTHHHDVHRDDRQLRQPVLYDLLHPDDRRDVHLLLDAFADDRPLIAHDPIFFVVVLVVDGLIGYGA